MRNTLENCVVVDRLRIRRIDGAMARWRWMSRCRVIDERKIGECREIVPRQVPSSVSKPATNSHQIPLHTAENTNSLTKDQTKNQPEQT